MRGLFIEAGIVINIAEFATPDDLFEGWIIAPDDAAIGWTDNIDGTFSAPAVPPPTADELATAERGWRNVELVRVDIEIRKAEDLLEAFDAVTWRRYAVLLRDWPENLNFPDQAHRPTSP